LPLRETVDSAVPCAEAIGEEPGEMEMTKVYAKLPLKVGFAPLDHHWAVPRYFTVVGEFADDTEVELAVEVDDEGTASCRKLEVRNAAVTSAVLRGVPIARLLAHGMTLASFEIGEPRPSGVVTLSVPTMNRRADFYDRHAKGARRPRKGSPLTDENLRQVAELYRAALKRGDAPTQTVADGMNVARSTAARWVAKARESGFLGPAIRGRAGEVS
jgi:hypothetical protein